MNSKETEPLLFPTPLPKDQSDYTLSQEKNLKSSYGAV